ncbi:hypothetical protein ABPG72_013459 [Tetrahymena utriculariae]
MMMNNNKHYSKNISCRLKSLKKNQVIKERKIKLKCKLFDTKKQLDKFFQYKQQFKKLKQKQFKLNLKSELKMANRPNRHYNNKQYNNKEHKINFIRNNYYHKYVEEYILDNNGNKVYEPEDQQGVYKVQSRQSTTIMKKIAEDYQDYKNNNNQGKFPVTLAAVGYAVNHALQILQAYQKTNSTKQDEVQIEMSTVFIKYEAEPLIQGLENLNYETINGKITIKFDLDIQDHELNVKQLNSIHISNRVARNRNYQSLRKKKGRAYKKIQDQNQNKGKQQITNKNRNFKKNNNSGNQQTSHANNQDNSKRATQNNNKDQYQKNQDNKQQRQGDGNGRNNNRKKPNYQSKQRSKSNTGQTQTPQKSQ